MPNTTVFSSPTETQQQASLSGLRIALLISGGVDSAVATHLLCEQGLKPDLFYIKIGMEGEGMSCTAEEDIELSQATARRYGLHLEVVDLQKEYHDRVVAYVTDRVKRGLTPNPDVMCNRLIKFGAFEERIGFAYDRIATGHYAQILRQPDSSTWLAPSPDPVKDQSDFLAQLTSQQVGKLLLPIGHLHKEEVRRIAATHHLAPAKRRDSQGICFLGKINYNDFIERYLGKRVGKIVELETGKVLGKHNGYWFHTIGQRKGLGLSGGPWFVIKKDIKRNIIYVSNGYDPETQYGKVINMQGFDFITEDPWGEFEGEKEITFKIRHTPEFTHGYIRRIGDLYRVESDEKIQGIAPGQYSVIYDKDHHLCLGSGMIIDETK